MDDEQTELNKDLCIAAMQKDIHAVRGLVEIRADVNYTYPGNGCPVLIYAANNRHHAQDIINFLLANSAIVDQPTTKYNSTALMTAARLGKLPLIKTLVVFRANVNHEDALGRNALWVAVHLKSMEMVQYLVENGANVGHSFRSGYSILQQAALIGDLEIITYLLANKADVNYKTPQGRTALHSAANANTSADVVKLLLANGAHVHVADERGHTALHDAVSSNCVETAKILLAHGITTDGAYCNGNTLFTWAARCGYKEMFRCLLEHQFGPSHSIWLRGQHPFDYLSHESQQQCTLLARLWSMRLSRPVNTFALLPLELLHMLLCFLSSAHFDN